MNWLDGLIAFWEFNESSDGSAAVNRVDSVAQRHAVDLNTSASTSAVLGNGVHFVGANGERLSVADDGGLTLHGDFTASCFFRMHGSPFGAAEVLITKGDSTGSIAQKEFVAYWVSSSGGRMSVSFSDGTSATQLNISAVARGTWHHLAFGRTSTEIWMQIDDRPRSTAAAVAPWSTADPLTFSGYSNGSFPVNADLDLFGLWSRSLSAAEVNALHHHGHGKSYSTLVRESEPLHDIRHFHLK